MKSHAIALAAIAAMLPLVAPAADYPVRPIRIVVPAPPGGGTDILARLAGKYLYDSWRQSVIVDNRPGGVSLVGMDIVARANPDGYTLMAIAAGPLDDDNLKYFAPITLFAAPPYLLVVHPAVRASSVKDLIAVARSQPGKLAYGSTGGGAASHLSTELFKTLAGVDILHVPYKGIGQAVTDLLGGQVQMMIGPSQALVPHARSGKLRALGVTSERRLSLFPDIPTVAESGLPGYEANGWFGLVAPARAPRELVGKINAEVNRIFQLGEVKKHLAELGAEPARTTPEEFLAFIRRENAKWDKLIRARGIEIERPRLKL